MPIDFEAPDVDACSSDPETPTATSLLERARTMRSRGPLVRLSTGLETLDKSCRGGFIVPRLVVFGGAPGAGKTSLVVWLAMKFASSGVPVVMLAVDEGADDILMRIALLEGMQIDRLEAGDDDEWIEFETRLEGRTLTILDGDDGWTMETAAAYLANLTNGAPGVLVIDSAQTVCVEGTADAESPRARLDAVMRALKRAAKMHRLLVLATSELTRSAYRSRNNAEHVNDLAAFKESGSIEYAAQTAIVLRSVPQGDGLIEATVPKNRGGKKLPFYLEIDSHTRVREVPAPQTDDDDCVDHTEADASKARTVLAERAPVSGKAALRNLMKLRYHLGKDRTDAAIELLGILEPGEADRGQEIENRPEKGRPRWYLRQGVKVAS